MHVRVAKRCSSHVARRRPFWASARAQMRPTARIPARLLRSCGYVSERPLAFVWVSNIIFYTLPIRGLLAMQATLAVDKDDPAKGESITATRKLTNDVRILHNRRRTHPARARAV